MDRTSLGERLRGAPSDTPGPGTHALLTSLLLRQDLPDATDAEVRAAVEHVERSVAAMPDVTRVAVIAVGVVVHALLSTFARGRFRRSAEREQVAAVARLSTMRAPGVGEYVKLTRGLALVAVHESRSRPSAGMVPR